MHRSPMTPFQPPMPKPAHVTFLEQLAALAEKRSSLLAEEAKLWSEGGRALAEFAASAALSAFSQNAAPVTVGGERKHLLDVKEAAKFLRLSKTTLDGWRLTRGGPEFVRLGRRIFYRLDVLESFLRRQSFPHTSAYPREE